MGKEARHLVRGAILLGLIIAGAIAVRQVVMPESWGQYGYYRGENVKEWANLSTTFANTQQCKGCHSAKLSQWTQGKHTTVSCENCHGPGEAHVEGKQALTLDRSNSLCLRCHEKLTARPKSFPQIVSASHNTGLSCTTCHSPHSPAIGQPPTIPHPTEGIGECLQCHGQGQLRPVPQGHAGRASDICLVCHQPKAASAPTPSGATSPGPTEAKATPTPTPATSTAASGPPRIPHTIEGRSECLACHASGVMGAPVPPANHAGRTNSTCQLCHQGATQ